MRKAVEVANPAGWIARGVGNVVHAALKDGGAPESGPGVGPASVARRDPSSEVSRAIAGMQARMDASSTSFGGVSARDFFKAHILDNPRVSDRQLIAMSKTTLDQVARSPAELAQIGDRAEGWRKFEGHRYTVDLMHIATGLPREQLSSLCPDLGITGNLSLDLADGTGGGVGGAVAKGLSWINRQLGGSGGDQWGAFHEPRTEGFAFSTALHDMTDYLTVAGASGLNRAVWGTDDTNASAVRSGMWATNTSKGPLDRPEG